MTRGERNNNPCNIRRSPSPWLGKITPSTDPDFEQFEEVSYGLRAAGELFLNYHRFHGLSTLAQIIGRFAPASENDTTAYVNDVAARMDVSADADLALDDAGTLANLVAAIVWHENGECIYTTSQINQSMNGLLMKEV